jgi:hypothetical protein
MLKGLFNRSENFNGVRIEELKPFERDLEKRTDSVWFQPDNIEKSIQAVDKLGIEHIHLQTRTVDFLKDERLRNLKGISVQYLIDDLSILYSFPHLTHLGIQEDNGKVFDFGNFKDLIYLSGVITKKYQNLDKLEKLKYTYLFNYRKKDFSEFSMMKDLRKLEFYSINCESLDGLSNLKKLEEINLEKCPKLLSLNGIDKSNINLKKVYLRNCKKLHDLSILSNFDKLQYLYLANIFQVDSLSFLEKLNGLDFLFAHPSNVGVKSDDYYPLIVRLKNMNKLEQLKGWRRLNDYLDNKVALNGRDSENLSALQLLLKNLSIKNWIEKSEDGLEQYTVENCERAEKIISTLISELEKTPDLTEENKVHQIRKAVLDFNKLNEELDYCFIETGEREELCDIFDNIAETVGIDTQNYEDGIASEWRDW